MNKFLILLILLFSIGFFSIISCTAPKNDFPDTIQHLSLFDTRWNLVEIDQRPIKKIDSAKTPYIHFSKQEMKATGNNGCNSFFADIDTIEEHLSFGPVGMTRMACKEGMETEMAFLAMLQASYQYIIDGYALLIMDNQGQVVGKFILAQ